MLNGHKHTRKWSQPEEHPVQRIPAFVQFFHSFCFQRQNKQKFWKKDIQKIILLFNKHNKNKVPGADLWIPGGFGYSRLHLQESTMFTFFSCSFYHLSPSCSGGAPRHQIQLNLYPPYSVSQAFSVQVALDIRALTFSHLKGMNSPKSGRCMKPLSCLVGPSGILWPSFQ